jgi:3-oxoacyl-[acyl-carrier protein] reductase
MSSKELEGKVAVVTGGSRGIGRAIAQSLAEAGAKVAIVARNLDGAQAAAAELPGEGHGAFACDVADPAQVSAAVKAVEESIGPIDIRVYNAGSTRDNQRLRMSAEDFDEVIGANLKGAFNFIKAVTKGMMKRRSGAILNVSSVVGLTGNAGQANYAASKSGLHGLTKSVAKELASRGVRCNCIAPGFITTDMTDELSDKQIDDLRAQIPLGTLGSPADVAGAVRFLVGPGARYITGQVLTVDGGMVM